MNKLGVPSTVQAPSVSSIQGYTFVVISTKGVQVWVSPPPVNNKRHWCEDHNFLQKESSNKRARQSRDDYVKLSIASIGLSSLFLKLLVILPPRIPRTYQEVIDFISEEDLTYLKNLPEVEMLKLFSEVTFYTY